MDRADMTAPMPETMSPREKVARIVDPWAFSIVANIQHTERAADDQAKALIKADAILAALASSGDHAELARLAEDPAMDFGGFGRSRVLALIAEVAALREDLNRKHEACQIAQDQAMENGSRAREAERKLAEAVGRQLPDISNDGPHKIDDHRYWLARQLLDSKLTADEAYSIVRHFPGISKEAERG